MKAVNFILYFILFGLLGFATGAATFPAPELQRSEAMSQAGVQAAILSITPTPSSSPPDTPRSTATPSPQPATQERLQVLLVQPMDGATGVQPYAPVTVFFDRPVVLLNAIEEAGALPDPLVFDPPVEGQGEWLNTATYQFTPGSAGFRRATNYTVRLPAGLTDTFGEAVLVDDLLWQFSTILPTVTPTPTPIPTPAPPLVTSFSPRDEATEVSPRTAVRINFNKPMYRQNVQDSFRLVEVAGGQPVPGSFTWSSNPESLLFTPAEPLTPAGVYRFELPPGVQAEYDRETLPVRLSVTFTVAPDPLVEVSYPSPGDLVDPGDPLYLAFNTAMDPGSIIPGQTLLITPTIPITQIYPYWRHRDNDLQLNLPLEFSQKYTVTLTTRVTNQHGQPLRRPFTLNFATRAQAALLFIESPGHIATYNAYTDTQVLLTTRNIDRVDLALYRLPVADLITFYRDQWYTSWDNYTPEPGNLLRSWRFQPADEPNRRQLHRLALNRGAGRPAPLEPGLYYLEASVPANATVPTAGWTSDADPWERQVLVVSNYNITLKESGHEALAWLTDLQSGQPVAGQPVTFLHNIAKMEARTDAGGVAQVNYGRWRDPATLRFAFVGDPDAPGDNFAMAVSRWDEGINRYHYPTVEVENSEPYFSGHFYTHRPLYRPGETIHFKGIIRAADDARYALPSPTRRVSVIIRDERGNEIYNQHLPLSRLGTVNDTLELAGDTALGIYRIQATYGGQTFFDTFEVSAYRPPDFSVEVQTDRARYAHGDSINVSVSASFFSGGPVSNARVRWTLLTDNFAPRGTELDAYDFVNEAYGDDYVENLHGGFGPRLAEGAGLTGPDGRFNFRVTADIAERLSSQIYTFDVVVTDINNQEVAGQARVLVNKGEFLVGLRPEQFVGRAGEENRVNLLAVDWAMQPVAGQPVEIVLAEYNRYSTQRLDPERTFYSGRDSYYWETVDNETAVFTTTVTTADDGQAVAIFTPDKGGIYRLYARATDASENRIQTSAFIWVSGNEYVNWGQQDNDRFELVANQPQYRVGEEARILVPHPFDGPTTALVTLERGHIYDHFVVDLPTNSTLLTLPVTAEMLPNMYVSVVVMQGAAPAADGLPAFAAGYVNLLLDPAEKELNISLTPDKAAGETYQPRENVSYDIQVTDVRGEPVQAELSLALVDQAVLSLAPEKPGQILQDFWFSRGLAVETASGLTLAIDRFNQAVIKAKGGGGGCVDCGGFEKGFGQTRLNLLDTALWVADFVTDEQGRGTVETALPDNLTTWTLTGIGVSGADTLVGESRVDIVSTKPLLVRPVTPRFFVVGDEAQIGIIVQNNTEEALPVELKFEADGLEIGQWRLAPPVESRWTDDVTPTLTVEPGQRVKVEYRVTVEKVAAVQLTLGVRSADNAYGDALSFSLPVYRASTPETVATAGQLTADGSRSEGISLPGSFDPTQGELTVDIAPSLAAGMRDGLTYLEHFPYECTEQTVSRFLPNAVTYRAYRALKVENLELAARLPGLLSVGVQRLYQYQQVDGGWGWWATDDSNPYLTAYVLLGLVEAERAGFGVSPEVRQRAAAYLVEHLAAPTDIRSNWQANRQAFMLYVLAEAGQGDLGRSVALFQQRRALLDLFGRAYLAMALHVLDPEAPQIETLLSDIHSEAIVSATGVHWEESQVDRRAMNTDTRTTAVVIAALVRLRPDHPSLPNAVRWLMQARGPGGYWSTTQETAWAIIGLTDFMVATGELAGKYAWQLDLNGDSLGAGSVKADNIDEVTRLRVEVGELLADTVNRLTIERTGPSAGESGTGRLYYAAYLTYYKPVEEVQALDRGIRVAREYRRLNDQFEDPISEAGLGDLIEVHLTIEAPNDLHYVLVEDPLPAGAEAINTSLATTSLVDQQAAESTGDDRRYFTHTELRDEKAVLFATYLRRGTYHYTYLIRASLPGRYHVIPTHAEEMYFPEVFGRSEGAIFAINEEG